MAKRQIVKALLSILIIMATILSAVSCTPAPEVDPIDDNYRTFYQVFVGSFSDANGDGYGDLRGIINRLDYLNDGNIHSGKSLGVQGLWLSPIFASPTYHKYDTTDYYDIDWRFGEESDLVELVEECHKRNVKVILDLVINHTSSQHPWFQSFRTARMNGDTENKYYDYYTFVTEDERASGSTYVRIANTDGYYECNFSSDMPELNYDNPEVRAEMLNVAKYYLDLGVDGFRFDAVKYIYYGNTTKTVDFWEWYMDELCEYKPDIYAVGECWSGESEIVSYYEALDCFNFASATGEGFFAKAAKGQSLATFTNYIVSFQNKIASKREGAMAMSFLSNHDMDRIAGTFVNENNMRMAANLYMLSPGSPMIYYGEEIGLRGSRGSANTDANRRLAMLWGDGDFVRNPVGSTYADDKQIDTTVKDQVEDPDSLYNYYCKLISVRHKYDAIARGKYSAVSGTRNLGGFLVEHEGDYLVILHNNSGESITYDLAELKGLGDRVLSRVLDSVGTDTAKIQGGKITVPAYTSVILK